MTTRPSGQTTTIEPADRRAPAPGRQRRALGALALLLTAAACAHGPRAGTGDVAFRLLWEGRSDLDLYVVDPAGDCIFMGSESVPSGGVLDVDCNAAPDRICERPIENVYWPPAAAPPGRYLFWVRVFNLMPEEVPLELELQLLRGERVTWRRRDEAAERGGVIGPFAFVWPDAPAPAPAVRDELPDCLYRAQ